MAGNANNKKPIEFDVRLQKKVDEEFARYETFIQSLQDKKVYARKRAEYISNIIAWVKEVNEYGRADNTAVSNTVGTVDNN